MKNGKSLIDLGNQIDRIKDLYNQRRSAANLLRWNKAVRIQLRYIRNVQSSEAYQALKAEADKFNKYNGKFNLKRLSKAKIKELDAKHDEIIMQMYSLKVPVI